MSATTPLREPAFLVLTALAAKPRHGYDILREVEQISHGSVTPQAGTLYAALDRLGATGWVDVDREEVVDGRLRRYYRLTEPGMSRLTVEVANLRNR